MQPKDFIQMLVPAAQEFQRNHGMFASVVIAQAALETGWGQFIPTDKNTGQVSYNLFGVKGKGTAGSVYCQTWEEYNGEKVTIDDYFAAYNNYSESIEGHNEFLLHGYDPVLNAKTPEEACEQLYKCGYATDSGYPDKLKDIIGYNNLTVYDLEKEDDEMSAQDKQMLNDVASTLQNLIQEVHGVEANFGNLDVPDWAKPTMDKLASRGILADTKGTTTFYRNMVALDRCGLLDLAEAIKQLGGVDKAVEALKKNM